MSRRVSYGRPMALLGYARVSTDLQNPALQLDALAAAGCDRTWTDQASGARTARPSLEELLGYARAGDTLVVWRLDRLGRSVAHLVQMVADLEARGIGFRSLTEAIDTTTAGGRLMLHVFAALAEFERDLIRARTVAGLDAARARGRVGGRPTVMTPERRAAADELLKRPGASVAAVARALGVSRASLRRYVETQAG
ncbi:MAG: recombinase family protein [Cellulomonadaceae bacterium]|nr:recombinase family protein [Cellulomonadaceae bacterium]